MTDSNYLPFGFSNAIKTNNSSQERVNYLRLARSENVGKTTFFRLLNIFGSAEKSLEQISSCAKNGGLKRNIKIASQAQIEQELEKTKNFGAEILLFNDKKYPRLLREISDPPPTITIKGDLELLERDIVAIVGPRNASMHGIAFARKIALELSQNSVTVVSGMARGIDSAAHESSILGGTVAVLAGGVNHIYPKSNEDLYQKITKHGLIMSENPFNFAPKGGNFIQRNRIISGLSFATLVIEAGLRSGSLKTAKYALNQGREVFAVPGSPFDERCQGSNGLIKDGANMLENIDDILSQLPSMRARFSEVGKISDSEIMNDEFLIPNLQEPKDEDIKKIRDEILLKLSFAPIAIDQIITEFNIAPRLVNIAIVELELAEKIEVNLGKVSLKIPF